MTKRRKGNVHLKIGILTLPLHNNYGGNLQVYALVTYLKKLGHSPYLVKIEPQPINIIPAIKICIKQIIKKYLFRYKNIGNPFFATLTKKERKIISQFSDKFINNYIQPQTINIKSNKDFRKLSEYNFDAYIVGSDQVWRKGYAKNYIDDFFLRFVKSNKVRKLSYAASFGIDYWEYNKRETKRLATLAKQFDYISVREESGISLCKEYLGVEAIQHVDPTLLLEKENYISIVEKENIPKIPGNLLYYILDMNDEKKQKKSVIDVNFRDKSQLGWAAHKESFTFENNKTYTYTYTYTYTFYQHIMFRRSCGVCYFTNFQRPSDITIADFWGWQKTDKEFNADDKGVSLVLVNTPKGKVWFDNVKNDINYIDSNTEDCLQPNLQYPTKIHPKRDEFEKDYKEKGFVYVGKKYSNLGWKKQFRYKYIEFKKRIKGMVRK